MKRQDKHPDTKQSRGPDDHSLPSRHQRSQSADDRDEASGIQRNEGTRVDQGRNRGDSAPRGGEGNPRR